MAALRGPRWFFYLLYPFQSFLRFYIHGADAGEVERLLFQSFLRFYEICLASCDERECRVPFQSFLRFYGKQDYKGRDVVYRRLFQSFLRFYRSCGWLLWVFKFFFGFLSPRRSV